MTVHKERVSTGAEPWPKPNIGISACLLGHKVRHNGEHKYHDWLNEVLGPYVKWVSVCPEVEMGLGVPRETMRLVGTAAQPKLVTVKAQKDISELAFQTIEKILKRDLELDCFIFKRDSPTCGMERVKVYGKSGIPMKTGIGLFSKGIQDKYPRIPLIEEGRLSDLKQKETFLIQLFSWTRFKRLPLKIKSLQEYHQIHKLQFMAFNPKAYSSLGRIAANSGKEPLKEVFENYETALAALLKQPLTIQKNINAFQHILGYFKTHLDSREKANILKLFEQYRGQKIPLTSLSTLFQFLVDKYSIEYLKLQTILAPYPNEIILN